MKRAFTLIEVSIAAGVGMILIGVIYFFYFGTLKTHSKAQEREHLNELANTTLERLVRELRGAESIVVARPDEISFKRYHVGSAEEEEANPNTGEKAVFDTMRYWLVKKERGVAFQRQLNMDKPSVVFSVDDCEPEIFQAYVANEQDPEKAKVSRLHLFDTTQQISVELERIVLVKLRLRLAHAGDTLDIRTCVGLPAVLARLRQANWNAE
jgi:type II secretory pathway pseudopilin PulG